MPPAEKKKTAPEVSPAGPEPDGWDLVLESQGAANVARALRAQVHMLDRSLGHGVDAWHLGRRHGQHAALSAARRARDLAAHRNRYAELAGRLDPAGPPIKPADVAAILGAMLGPCDDAALDGVRAELASLKAQLDDRLGKVRAQLSALRRRETLHPVVAAVPHAFDWQVRYGRDLLAAEAELLRLGGDAESSLAVPVKGQAGTMAGLVERHGGRGAVVAMLRDARALDVKTDHDRRIGELTDERLQAEARADRLGGLAAEPQEGSLLAQLAARRDAAARQIDAARADRAKHHEARAHDVLALALQGREGARAEVERLARAVPDAFPAGFADDAAAARFERGAQAAGWLLVGLDLEDALSGVDALLERDGKAAGSVDFSIRALVRPEHFWNHDVAGRVAAGDYMLGDLAGFLAELAAPPAPGPERYSPPPVRERGDAPPPAAA